jgi:hypothetical protein
MRGVLLALLELFMGRGGSAAALPVTAQTYLADVLERIVSGQTKVNALSELLPWKWKAARAAQDVKAAA